MTGNREDDGMVSQHSPHGAVPPKRDSEGDRQSFYASPAAMLADGVQPNLSIEVHAEALYSRILGDQPRAAMARDADFKLSCKEFKP